ncbi:hypothetical protein [Anaerocolumna sp.]|uniref:hypothetical protein n=1 Tax=Anaerocolumna sp. TaxID=2041569 RepID=UPI0028A80450|nr:hypothetical protein [Anaerocolumna sp.]
MGHLKFHVVIYNSYRMLWDVKQEEYRNEIISQKKENKESQPKIELNSSVCHSKCPICFICHAEKQLKPDLQD